jgi:hypothetical protein
MSRNGLEFSGAKERLKKEFVGSVTLCSDSVVFYTSAAGGRNSTA